MSLGSHNPGHRGTPSVSDFGDNTPPTSNYYLFPAAPASSLPTDVAALHSIVNTLQAQLQASTTVNTHLAASVARLQTEKATTNFTPATSTTSAATTNTTPTPVPRSQADQPPTIASGRGAASPEIFQQMMRTNWHGRLGRAHMMDVDSMPGPALMELDGLVRRKLRGLLPRGAACTYSINVDETFGGLAALGLRLENRDRYMCQILGDGALLKDSTTKRARDLAEYYYANEKYTHNEYMRGFLIETLVELGRYRGLFDNEGYLRDE